MWVFKYVVYVGFKCLNDDLWVEFIEHFMSISRSPTQVKTRSKHDSKRPEDRSMKLRNSKDQNRRCGSSHGKYPYPNRGENDVKDPHDVRQILKKVRETLSRKMGPNRAEKGMGWLAHFKRLTPFQARFATPFDQDAPWLIYGLCLLGPPHPFIKEPPN
jgi:hypothetical protein